MKSVAVAVGLAVFLTACGGGDDEEAGPPDGRQLFADNCATCHGERGEGLFRFPPLAGVVVTKYPNPEDQIAVVSSGRGEMPAFAGQLSPEEIRAVVDFTRTLR